MSDQQSELAKPNLQQPLTERIWRYLKENPNKDCRAIGEALGKHQSDVASSMGALKFRGLVQLTAKGVKNLGTRKWVHGNLWSCTDVEKEPSFYARGNNKESGQKVPKLYRRPQALVETRPAKSVEEQADEFVNGAALEVAHAIYLKLKAYFEPKVL